MSSHGQKLGYYEVAALAQATSIAPTCLVEPQTDRWNDGLHLLRHEQELVFSLCNLPLREELKIEGDLADPGDFSVERKEQSVLLKPGSFWKPGSGRTLSLTNGENTHTFHFHILDGNFYVRTPEHGGSDAHPGTAEQPTATIQAAVHQAKAWGGHASVHVAAGDYTVSSQDGNPVRLFGGLSLQGGYAPDDWNEALRDSDKHVTSVQDTSTEGQSTNNMIFWAEVLSKTHRTIECVDQDTPAQVDGFHITGGGGLYSTAVLANNCQISLQNNTIFAGSASGAAIGVFSALSRKNHPAISDNIICGGNTDYLTGGILTFYSSPVVSRNHIHSGKSNEAKATALWNEAFTKAEAAAYLYLLGTHLEGTQAEFLSSPTVEGVVLDCGT